ncbi:hypothetical protein BX666DRAFT_2126528 [Dichotomocladium elegans]|nr:hypothetical protein BX666DRAFT_2126528 [Dichotomocladium elegans]
MKVGSFDSPKIVLFAAIAAFVCRLIRLAEDCSICSHRGFGSFDAQNVSVVETIAAFAYEEHQFSITMKKPRKCPHDVPK